MKSSHQLLAIACGLMAASLAQAQRPKSASQAVPPDLRPPAGMCRVWVDGVPPGRQPAPTDCASALRNRPPKGRVIFGDDFAAPGSADRSSDDRSAGSPLKGLAPMPRGLDQKPADTRPPVKKPDDANKKKGDARNPDGKKPDSTQAQPLPGLDQGSPASILKPILS